MASRVGDPAPGGTRQQPDSNTLLELVVAGRFEHHPHAAASLHGAVERERSHLIVTDRDFGQAYLADAWATPFLMTMFEAYVVLFVGYSHAAFT
jgi:hypothetical protein